MKRRWYVVPMLVVVLLGGAAFYAAGQGAFTRKTERWNFVNGLQVRGIDVQGGGGGEGGPSNTPGFLWPGTSDLSAGGGQAGKIQTRTDGSLEFTDNAVVPLRHRGFLLPFPLTFNLNIEDCYTDENGGKTTFNALGQMICAPDVVGEGGGGSGDITQVGTITTGAAGTTGAPFTGLWWGQSVQPNAPAATQGLVWLDDTTNNLSVRTADGVVKRMVQSQGPTEHFFLTALSPEGEFSAARPSSANLSDGATLARLTAPQVLTQTQVADRVCLLSATSGTVGAPNVDGCNIFKRYDVGGAIDIPTPTATGEGNPRDMQIIMFDLRAASAVQTITWSSAYEGGHGQALPDSIPSDRYMAVFFRYNLTATKWELFSAHDPDIYVNSILFRGTTSGIVTVQPQAAAGTFNFNLPTTAGTAGQPLLSGGGGATAMTFGTLSVAGGGTGATTLTGVVRGNGTSPQTAAELSGAVTTSGSNVTVMSTPFRVKSCSYTFGNTGADEPALASDTDEDDACMNDFGVAWTITAVACKADTATGTPTANVKQTTTGGSSILTGAISCGTSWTAGTLSGTPTVNSFSGSGNATCSSAPCNLAIDLTPGGTAKRITVKIVGTIPAS